MATKPSACSARRKVRQDEEKNSLPSNQPISTPTTRPQASRHSTSTASQCGSHSEGATPATLIAIAA